MTYNADDAAAMTPTNALLVDLVQSIADLKLQVGGLQAQITNLSPDVYKDPVCQVNELIQKGLLADYSETKSYVGPDHERVHTCSWTHL